MKFLPCKSSDRSNELDWPELSLRSLLLSLRHQIQPHGQKLQTNFKVLDSKIIASGLNISEEAAHEENAFSRNGAWMNYKYFNVSDTDESVSVSNEIWKAELKNDSVQPFKTRWDGTIIVMKKEPDDEFWAVNPLMMKTTLFFRHAFAPV